MNGFRLIFCALMATLAAEECLSHTTAESNDVVRVALWRAAHYYPCAPDEAEPPDGVPPDTWRGLLGGDTNGWTFAEKMAAFDWYLTTLGTKDCKSAGFEEHDEIGVAIACCGAFYRTNSLPALKALALNPKGIHRGDAIEIVLKFGEVSDDMTAFVETIMTNTAAYSRIERGVACGCYSERLISYNTTNGNAQAVWDRAVAMLYRNRNVGLAGVNMLDNLFTARITGYDISSNRLEFANFVLGHADAREFNIRKFTSVTNQLLSSGQPLPWINMGDGGN